MDESDASHSARRERYEGEDTTPTSDKELQGWYSYGLAAEVFAVVGVGSFLPVTLEQLARENGVLYSDRTTPCIPPPSSPPPASLAGVGDVAGRLLMRAAADEGRDQDQCLVHVFGADVTTASFAMYTFSVAVFVQALVLVSFSSFADHGDNRKRLLLGFAFTGAVTSMSFMFVFPSIYMIAPFLVVIGVTSLGCSFVLLNSFLPLLAANHPSIRDMSPAHDAGKLLDPTATGSPELQLSTKISAKGVGIGYAAAVFVQCLGIVVLVLLNKVTTSKTIPLRCVLLLAGLWWFLFTIPAAMWLRKRPGPPLLATRASKGGVHKYLEYVRSAWSSLWTTIRVAVRLRQAAIFLVAWFLLSDAVATVSGTAILFARTELKMGTVAIALLSITATASGIAGSIIWPILSRRYGWRTNRTIVACMVLMEIIPLYGLLGYLPFVRTLGFGGLQKSWEIYPLGIVHGVVMGGISSYCRSFFGLLIPPGHEVAFYALFAITDKGSSAIGPAIVGRIVDLTGHIRPAFIFLAVLILLPMPLVWYVDAEIGQADAVSMAAVLAGGGSKGLLSEEDVELRSRMRNSFEHGEEEGEALMARPS